MWSTEYLLNLQQRKKLQNGKTNIDINDVVMFKEKNTPPILWPMGLITKIIDGSDKTVRVVELEISSGLFIRSVNKLVFYWKTILTSRH